MNEWTKTDIKLMSSITLGIIQNLFFSASIKKKSYRQLRSKASYHIRLNLNADMIQISFFFLFSIYRKSGKTSQRKIS